MFDNPEKLLLVFHAALFPLFGLVFLSLIFPGSQLVAAVAIIIITLLNTFALIYWRDKIDNR